MRSTNFTSLLFTTLAMAATALLVACGNEGGDGPPLPTPTLQILSSKAEYVSGGSVLIDVTAPPAQTAVSPLVVFSVMLNGADVTSTFKADPRIAP